MADLERFRAESVSHVDLATTLALAHHGVAAFLQPLECHKAYTTIFVAEIGPDYIVEYVSFDSIYSPG